MFDLTPRPSPSKIQRKQTNKNKHKGLTRPSLWRQPRGTGLFSSGSHRVAGWFPSGAKWLSSHSCDNIMALCRPGCPNVARARREGCTLFFINENYTFSQNRNKMWGFFFILSRKRDLVAVFFFCCCVCSPPRLHSAIVPTLAQGTVSLLHTTNTTIFFTSVCLE